MSLHSANLSVLGSIKVSMGDMKGDEQLARDEAAIGE